MKEKEKKLKEIKIPRLAVYIVALFAAIVICIGMFFTFGVAYVAEFATLAVFNCVIAFVAYNIIDKWDEQPWRLTPSYWGEVVLIVLTDVLFIFTAKASTAFWGGILVAALIASGAVLLIYTFAIYSPKQMALLADVKKKVKEAVAKYIGEHTGETPEAVADGLVELVMAPKENIMTKGEENA